MLPTLKPGDTILVWRFSKPKVGDIVVAYPKGVPIIKRVEKTKNGQLFLVGDNPQKSTDSRQFGWVDRKQILGLVLFIL